MSIRHYTPRRRRRGISQRARVLLGAVLAATILLQIAYPLTDGSLLKYITVTTVYMGALTMLLHAYLSFGSKYALRYLILTVLFGYFIEFTGVHTGWPFGIYKYDSSLGLALFGVPIVVPFAWVMMVHPALVAARRVTPRWTFLYGGALLAAWDLFLDPQMVAAERWTWEVTGSHIPFVPDVPLSNFFGWLLAGCAIVSLLNVVLPFERRKESASVRAVTILLTWVLFSGLIGNLFFFDRPGLAFLGTVVFGAFATPFIYKSWLGEA
jgi:putative membrane protein